MRFNWPTFWGTFAGTFLGSFLWALVSQPDDPQQIHLVAPEDNIEECVL